MSPRAPRCSCPTLSGHHCLCFTVCASSTPSLLLLRLRMPLHRRGTRTREERLRRAPCGVRARLRASDEERDTGDSFDRMIPLEVLSACTVILHMRAVSQIALVQHFYAA